MGFVCPFAAMVDAMLRSIVTFNTNTNTNTNAVSLQTTSQMSFRKGRAGIGDAPGFPEVFVVDIPPSFEFDGHDIALLITLLIALSIATSAHRVFQIVSFDEPMPNSCR